MHAGAPLPILASVKLFACDRCQQLVFFENVACTRCGQALAYLPDQARVGGIAPAEPGLDPASRPGAAPASARWRALRGDGPRYRLCRNWTEHGVCNWTVPDGDPEELCRACRLNQIIPPLVDPAARASWTRLEAAKRRLVYSLLRLGLPLAPKHQDPARGLAFSFKKQLDGEPVSTGHSDGVITIDVAEADAPFRERVRVELGEPYRTLLGHFRHEVGHYYWARLIQDGPWLARCRERFGDERADYAEAMQRHYRQGPPADWPQRFVSAYASMHPWEDWAETFAHYLHLVDVLETARAHGLSVRPAPAAAGFRAEEVSAGDLDPEDFEELLGGFMPLTLALNDLNRSMGLQDPYPFVLCPAAIEKLRLVHEVVAGPR